MEGHARRERRVRRGRRRGSGDGGLTPLPPGASVASWLPPPAAARPQTSPPLLLPVDARPRVAACAQATKNQFASESAFCDFWALPGRHYFAVPTTLGAHWGDGGGGAGGYDVPLAVAFHSREQLDVQRAVVDGALTQLAFRALLLAHGTTTTYHGGSCSAPGSRCARLAMLFASRRVRASRRAAPHRRSLSAAHAARRRFPTVAVDVTVASSFGPCVLVTNKTDNKAMKIGVKVANPSHLRSARGAYECTDTVPPGFEQIVAWNVPEGGPWGFQMSQSMQFTTGVARGDEAAATHSPPLPEVPAVAMHPIGGGT